MARRKYVVGNWKMHGLSADLAEIQAIADGAKPFANVDVALCLPAILIERAARAVPTIAIGAQDVHFADKGAHTGCVSAAMLRDAADWFHYSVDFRIGTRYMGEHIVDNFKREAMRNPFLRQLLRSDSIYIASNITFHNLDPLSTYLGKPGDPAKGGIPFAEYKLRQNRFPDISVKMHSILFLVVGLAPSHDGADLAA